MLEAPAISLNDEIAEVERELRMRGRVYPRLIRDGKLMRYDADLQMERLRAVLRRLKRLQSAAGA